MLILAVESSHDDTSIALVKNHQVIFNYQISQIDIHAQYGGTIPEIASREHYHNFYLLLNRVIKDHKTQLDLVDAIVYTSEPGLIGSLQMGKIFAHALSTALNKPIYPVNHLDGHIFSVLLTDEEKFQKEKIKYPALALIVSGGHTNLYYLKSPVEKQLLGQTLDDALGEVFDKVGRTLELPFPAGPKIDALFQANQNINHFPVKFNWPKLKEKHHFSFSGFKTQVVNLVKKDPNLNTTSIAISFQKNVIDYVIQNVKDVINDYRINTLILGGGVSANSYLRSEFLKLFNNVLIPKLKYSTDNAAMIGVAYFEQATHKNK